MPDALAGLGIDAHDGIGKEIAPQPVAAIVVVAGAEGIDHGHAQGIRARDGHLVEDDLIAALDSGHLSGATLDVFATEPLPETSPLWTHPKITVTPHIAAISAPRVAAQYVVDGIARFERGEKLQSIVDLTRGY